MRTRIYTIECDGCGDDGINELYRTIAEEKARREGWSLGKRDLCPECREVNR